MNKYVVKTEDKIVEQVIEKIDQRSLVGQAKYGAMMMEEVEGKDKDLNDFLNDAIGDMVVVLTNLAELGGTSIEQCIDAAYAEIKNRKGKMVNGTFVKND